MRARHRLTFLLLTAAFGSIAVAAPVANAAPPRVFSLPESTPTPSPTPEVEGPADDAGVVPVQPRVIADEPASDTAPEQPTTIDGGAPPAPAPATSQPVVQPLPSETEASVDAPPQPTANPLNPPQPNATPTRTIPAQPATTPATGPVEPPGSAAALNPASAIADPGPLPGLGDPAGTALELDGSTPADGTMADWLWWLLGLAAIAVLGIAGWFYTRQRTAPAHLIEKPVLAGAKPIASMQEAKLNPSLEIISATRSVMMLTIEYHLVIANRSTRAVRELSVTPELTTARRGGANGPGPAMSLGTGETHKIARIGPHQSEAVTGQVQLPVSEIQPILQGSTPLFVPLLHLQLSLERLAPITHSFVMGLPSEASTTRLHPISLDTPPGGLPPLQTRLLSGEAS